MKSKQNCRWRLFIVRHFPKSLFDFCKNTHLFRSFFIYIVGERGGIYWYFRILWRIFWKTFSTGNGYIRLGQLNIKSVFGCFFHKILSIQLYAWIPTSLNTRILRIAGILFIRIKLWKNWSATYASHNSLLRKFSRLFNRFENSC